jgi:hypothetical protein
MRGKVLTKFIFAASVVMLLAITNVFAQIRKPVAKPIASRSLTILTEPKAIIWLDNIRRGVTGETGSFKINKVAAGSHSLRVRAVGFAEKTTTVSAAQRGEIKIALVKTTDEAELAFQQAEETRESARDKTKAVELYRRALELRPDYAEAHVGLARLFETSNPDEALAHIEKAREIRPNYAEASTVEGRIHRESLDTENAIKSFRRALREAKNIQPEAHTGLALTYRDNGDYENAATEFKTAIVQLADSDPAIYRLLAEMYEKMQRKPDAIAVYEKFLQIAPDDVYASGVRSIIEQLKKQDSGETLDLMPQ